MMEYTANGIGYTWELASREGASFILFPEAKHTKEQVKEAKHWLLDNHDVVSLRIGTEEDLDDLYKTEYFRDKRVKQLNWYEIEQDAVLIRKARKAGLPTKDFVTQYVVPNIAKVRKRNQERYGDLSTA